MRQVTLRRPIWDAAGHVAEATAVLTIAGGFTHGEQITRTNIGPTGPLAPVAGFSTTTDGAVYENLEISGGVGVKHHTTLRNCRIIGSPSAASAGYTIKHVLGTGKRLVLENCEVLTRSPAAKGLTMYGNGGLYAHRTVFRGGTDNAFLKPAGGPHFEGYAAVLRECWFGDLQTASGAHCDCIQVDGGDGGLLIERCRIESFLLPSGTDPTAAQADGQQVANGGLLCTQNSSAPSQIDRVHLVDSWVDGANWTVYTSPNDGLAPTGGLITGCRWGLKHRYGPLIASPGSVLVDNTWGQTGTTGSGQQVVAGQPVG